MFLCCLCIACCAHFACGNSQPRNENTPCSVTITVNATETNEQTQRERETPPGASIPTDPGTNRQAQQTQQTYHRDSIPNVSK